MHNKVTIYDQRVDEELEFLAQIALDDRKKPAKLRNALVFVGGAIGVVAAFVYYNPTQEMIQENDYPVVYNDLLIASSLGVNAQLNIFFNAQAVKIMFNLRDPVTKGLKVSSLFLNVTGLVSFASAFVPAFLAPPEDTLFSYVNFFGQLVCHTAQSYVGIMMAFLFIRGLRCSTPRVSPALKFKLELTQTIEALLSDSSLEAAFDMRQFKEDDQISPQKISMAMISKRSELQLLPSESKTQCTSQLGIYGFVQGVGAIAQILSLVGFLNNTINGFHSVMSMPLAKGSASVAIIPMGLTSLLVSYYSFKKIFTINPFSPLKNLPYEIKKTPYFSSVCLLINTTLAIFSFSATEDLLLDAIYNTSLQDNPSQFTWMDNAGATLKGFYSVLACFGTVFFNAFPLPEMQTALSRGFYLLTADASEAKDYREKSELIATLETMKEQIEEMPAEAISVSGPEPELEPEPEDRSPRRRNLCETLMRWFRSPANGSDDSYDTAYSSLNA